MTASPSSGDGANGATRRRGGRSRRHTVAKVLLSTTLVLALVVGLSAVYFLRKFSGNIEVVDVLPQLTDRPSKIAVEGPKQPLNILAMGSDSREGAGNNIDGLTGGGERSDTTILLHVSADRERAYGVSIPRDSMVARPECNRGTIPGSDRAMWNEAFALGGEACTMQQFEQLTGIRLDHFVVVNFQGFKDMVDAIDGVEVCIPQTIDDREHGIYLEAGTREIQGREALNYVRVRSVISANGDIGRMRRQQAFVAAMANKVISADTLARPDRLVGFLDAATKSLKVDAGLSELGDLVGLGRQFQDIGLDKIQFLTVPWEWDPVDPNRVVWSAQANRLWKQLAKDERLSRRLTGDVITAERPTRSPAGGSGGSISAGVGAASDDEVVEREADENGLCA